MSTPRKPPRRPPVVDVVRDDREHGDRAEPVERRLVRERRPRRAGVVAPFARPRYLHCATRLAHSSCPSGRGRVRVLPPAPSAPLSPAPGRRSVASAARPRRECGFSWLFGRKNGHNGGVAGQSGVGGRGERGDFRVPRGPEGGRKVRNVRSRPEPAGEADRRRAEIEERRLAVLADYEILDTPADQGFDELVQLASDLCGAPVALVGIVGRDRVWIKAGIGLAEAGATIPQLGLFADVVNRGELLEIDDVRDHPRFAHPGVEKLEGLRFFAAAPLVTDEGAVLGALCVLDHAPRSLSEQQRADLRALAHQVVAQLALRRALLRAQRAEQALRTSEEQFRAIADTTREWIHDLDADGTITYSNPAVEQLLGSTSGEVVGRNVADLVHDDDRDALVAQLADFRRDPRELVLPAIRFLDCTGRYRWLEGNAVPIFTASGSARGHARRAPRRHRPGGDAAAADRPRRTRRPDGVAEPARVPAQCRGPAQGRPPARDPAGPALHRRRRPQGRQRLRWSCGR